MKRCKVLMLLKSDEMTKFVSVPVARAYRAESRSIGSPHQPGQKARRGSSRRGDLKKSTTNARECKEDIVRDHAMILPDNATPKPDGIVGKDTSKSSLSQQ